MKIEIAKLKHEPGVWGVVTSRHASRYGKTDFVFVLVERTRMDGSKYLGEEIQFESDVELVSHEIIGV